MSGRYVSPDEAAIERECNLVRSEWQFPPSFNAAPTQNVPVIRSVDGKPHGSLMRWGLIPFYEWQVQSDGKTKVPDDLTVAWPVSTRVNTPKNNDARLIEPA